MPPNGGACRRSGSCNGAAWARAAPGNRPRAPPERPPATAPHARSRLSVRAASVVFRRRSGRFTGRPAACPPPPLSRSGSSEGRTPGFIGRIERLGDGWPQKRGRPPSCSNDDRRALQEPPPETLTQPVIARPSVWRRRGNETNRARNLSHAVPIPTSAPLRAVAGVLLRVASDLHSSARFGPLGPHTPPCTTHTSTTRTARRTARKRY